MMDLNERAAKVMGWTIGKAPYRNFYLKDASPTGFAPELFVERLSKERYQKWNPKHDYNHARMLYQRVVEEDLLPEIEYALLNFKREERPYCSVVVFILDLTSSQITEACCEVLEANETTNPAQTCKEQDDDR